MAHACQVFYASLRWQQWDGRRKSGRLGAAHLRGGGVGARTSRRLRPDLFAAASHGGGDPAATAWSTSPEEKREEGWGLEMLRFKKRK
uniref:Uncharacterized protein n=1 Tax=Oryza nivara TaxID=4536 RepID=A0A0E0IPV5_ORYNI